jgi:uncharacterized protein (DUF58 family)
MLLASINYQSNAAWLLVLLVLVSGALSAVHGWRNLAAASLVAGDPPLVQAGEPARIQIQVVNEAGHELVALLVEPAQGEVATFVPLVPAKQRVRTHLVLPPFPRGVHRLSSLVVATQYPLGLFLFRRRIPILVELVVYPRPAGAGLGAAAHDGLVIASGRASTGTQAEDFRGLRPWQSGDSPRHIDWKAAARSEGALQTKEWTGGGEGTIWFTWNATTGEPEVRLAQLAKWVLEAGARGLTYGLRLPGGEFAPASDHAHQEACLRALATYQPGLGSSGRRPGIIGVPV